MAGREWRAASGVAYFWQVVRPDGVGLENEGGAPFCGDEKASGAAAGGAGGIEDIGGQGVFIRFDEGVEAIPEAAEAILFEPALEETLLDAEAEVLASEGDAAEAFRVGDVVCDEAEHFRVAWRLGVAWREGREEVVGKVEV